MTSVSKTYTFVAGTDAKGTEVNQNFDDIITYVNNEVVVRDGSTAFTAVPSGPATNPSSDNQLTRKKYVDDQDTAISTTVTANKTAADNAFLVRPTISGSNNQIIKSASVTGYTNSVGDLTITFPVAFPSSIISVVACSGDAAAGRFVSIVSYSRTAFTVRVWSDSVSVPNAFGVNAVDRYAGNGTSTGLVRIHYFATGT